MKKESRLLRIGVLGCGPISQIAHFDACRKARNAELYAVCDAAEDLLARAAAIHSPRVTYQNFDDLLADPQVEAVIIGVAEKIGIALRQPEWWCEGCGDALPSGHIRNKRRWCDACDAPACGVVRCHPCRSKHSTTRFVRLDTLRHARRACSATRPGTSGRP